MTSVTIFLNLLHYISKLTSNLKLQIKVSFLVAKTKSYLITYLEVLKLSDGFEKNSSDLKLLGFADV